MTYTLLEDDFTSFPIGSFPFDHAHTAMGEYHYYPVVGYTGQWYDPIVNANYRGPSWLITEQDGKKYIEQMRVRNPLTKNVSPLLVAEGLMHGRRGWSCVPLSDLPYELWIFP